MSRHRARLGSLFLFASLGQPLCRGFCSRVGAVLTVLVMPPTTTAAADAGDDQPPAGHSVSMETAAVVVPHLLLQSEAVVFRHGPPAQAIEDPRTQPGFYLRRARLGFDALADIWRARLMIEAAAQAETAAAPDQGNNPGPGSLPPPTGSGDLDPIAGALAGRAPRVTEAFVSLAPHKAFTLALGSMRVPIGLSRQMDEGDLRLPERARIIIRATPDFRVGLAASGDMGLLQYSVGAYAAAPHLVGRGSDFASGGTLYVLRLAGEPVGPMGVAPHLRRRADPWYGWWRFSTGLSGFHVRLPGENESGAGGDVQFQWRRLCITGELLWTRRSTTDRVGFTFEPGVFVIPETLELVARLEWFNDQVGPRSPVDAWGASAGASFFSKARHVRAHLAYTWRRPLAGVGDERASGWVLLRATFIL